MTKDLGAQALRTALDPSGEWMPVGAGRRRPPADRGTPARPRRGRSGDRHRPGLRPRVRRAAEEDQRRAADGGALRREGGVEADRGVHRVGRRAGWSRCGWVSEGVDIPRLAVGVYATSDVHAALLRPGRGPLRAGAGARRDRVGVPAVGADICSATPPRWRSSATTCSGARDHRRGRHLRRRAGPARRGRTPTSARPTSCSGTSQALGSQARFDQVVYDGGGVRSRRRGARRVGRGDGLPRHPRAAGARPGTRAAPPPAAFPAYVRGGHRRARRARGLDPRAARDPAPRAERPRRRLAPPHRPGPRRHACRPAQGARRTRPPRSRTPTSSTRGSTGCASGPSASLPDWNPMAVS